MRCSKHALNKNYEGTIHFTPDDADDIWTLYNLIEVGDRVESPTSRKVVVGESGSSDTHKRITLVLAVDVEKSEVDLHNGILRVNGKNVKENQWVKLGSYHTIEIEVGNWVKIWKAKWDRLSLQLVKNASNISGKFQVGAIILQKGVAQTGNISSDQKFHSFASISANFPKRKRVFDTLEIERITGIAFRIP